MKAPLFIIGTAKAGTSALFEMLAQHPGILPARVKEPHYFSHLERTARYTGPGDDQTINREVISDPSAYEALFVGNPEIRARCEASTSYLYLPGTAQSIHRKHPDARIVAVLRDPVERAFSAYLFQVTRGYETLPFEEALRSEAERIQAGWHHIWHYVAMGRYYQQIRAYQALFPPEQLLILDHRSLRDEADATVHRVLTFCGLDAAPINTQIEVNRSGRPVSQTFGRLLFQENLVKRALVPLLSDQVRKRLSSILRRRLLTRESLPPAAVEMILALTAEDSQALARDLGSSLQHWRFARG